MAVTVRDMQPEDEEFVGSCMHVHETEERTASCKRRILWLRDGHKHGVRAKVALVDGAHAGFLYLRPVEVPPWQAVGRDLMFIQCMQVKEDAKNHGVGRAWTAAAEEEAHRQGQKGVVVCGFYHDFWFMPASFFEKLGFTLVKRRGDAAILWRTFDDSAVPPSFPERHYRFVAVPGKVAIDLFWSRSCLATDVEAQRVREVAAEFADAVALRGFCTDDAATMSRYGIPRAIFIDGREVGWGHEAPKDGLRTEIRKPMSTNDSAL